MRIPELKWSQAGGVGYDDDLLLDIQSCAVVLLIRGRNAWHGKWVRHYLRNATLYTDVASAKAGAETQRQRGSVFYIVEAPAVQLRGALTNVVLCDTHPADPFGAFVGIGTRVQRHAQGNWIDGLFPGVSVRDAVEAFAHDSGHWKGPVPNEHSLRSGLLAPDVVLSRGSRRLESLISEARGAKYYLGWRSVGPGSFTRRGASSLSRKWQRLLSAAGADDPTDGGRSACLVRYRDSVLRAIPRSTWQARKAERDLDRLEARSAAHESWMKQLAAVAALKGALARAEAELSEARQALMHPAKTSAGVRRQRERAGTTATRVAGLARAVEQAQGESEERFQAYWDLLGEL